MSIDANSALAYRLGQERAATTREAILELLDGHDVNDYAIAMSDMELAEAMGEERYLVAPRVTELLDRGLITVACHIQCHVTGQRVRRVRLATSAERQAFALVKRRQKERRQAEPEPVTYYAVKPEGYAGRVFQNLEAAKRELPLMRAEYPDRKVELLRGVMERVDEEEYPSPRPKVRHLKRFYQSTP